MKAKRITTFLSLTWLLTILALFLYSFTQIDLGLTLTRVSWWQIIQKKFQSIGYFNRSLSTGIYLAILFILYPLYFILLLLVKRKKFTAKQIWRLIFITAVILWLSYNALSYDLFNYIFDAKIFTFYGQNPYQHKALDFPGDPMLGFMHWTHRTYPYGPTWLAFTIPLSFLGFQKLIPTALLIKGLAVGSYLLATWSIFKILEKTDSQNKFLGLTIFAFSPFVLIESLVSAHNDIVMMAFALAGFWLLVKKKYVSAWLMLFLSIGIKFATALLVAAFFWVSLQQWRRKKVIWERIWLFSFFLMVLAVLAAIKRDELKPWYLLYLWPFVALMPEKGWLFWPVATLSAGLLLHYTPFLYWGNWDPPVPMIKLQLTFFFLAGGIIVYVLIWLGEKIVKSGRVKPGLMVE